MKTLHWTSALVLGAGIALAGWSAATAQSPQGQSAGQAKTEQGWKQASRDLNAGDIRGRLKDQGYGSIVLASKEPPFTTAYGCVGKDDFRLTLDKNATVVGREAVGRCGGKESVAVRAPFTDVDVEGKDVHVRAPFTGVDVDKGGVHVRAPFVDLNIPR